MFQFRLELSQILRIFIKIDHNVFLMKLFIQSGFNYGYGRGWIDVVPLDHSSGRHLYLIHSEKPVKGGCDVRRECNEGSFQNKQN